MRHASLALTFALLTGLASAQGLLKTVSGGALGGEFGTSIALVNDFDLDGKNDFAVGSPHDDTAGNDAGAVRVLSGADGSVIRTVYGKAPGEQFGYSVAGFNSLLGFAAGAPYSDANGVNAGLVRIIDGTNGATLKTFNGAAAGDRFGWSIEIFGNGALFSELLAIGAPYSNAAATDGGSVTILYSSGDSPGFSPSVLKGTQAGQHFGWALATKAYTTGGGTAGIYHQQLMVGSPDYDSPAVDGGRVDVWDMSWTLPFGNNPSNAFVASYNGAFAGMKLGTSVCGLQSLVTDFVASAPTPAADNGIVLALHVNIVPGTLTLMGSFIQGNGFGACVARAGNLNGGTNEDFYIGAPHQTNGVGSEVGAIYAYDGATLAPIGSVFGIYSGGQFGAAIAGGTDGLAIGAPHTSFHGAEAGHVQIRSALSGFGSIVANVIGTTKGDGAGRCVAGVGDVNLDGIPDWLVGSPYDANPGLIFGALPLARVGSARVISGATGASLRTHYGADFGDELGWSAASLGDVNLDGVPDYVVGAPQRAALALETGYVKVFSGANGSQLYDFPGAIAGGDFGYSVGGGSDVNGDGRPDVIIGGPGTANGTVYTYSGSNGALLGTLTGQALGDRFGHSVAGLGADLSGDGKQEYLVGAPLHAAGGTDAGRVYVMRATTSFLTKWIFDGAVGDQLGTSVARAGDVNRDGTPDLIAGAPGHDLGIGFANTGLARVWSGANGALLFTASSTSIGGAFGTSVAGLGDVDNDGYADVAIGASPGSLITASGFVRVVSGKAGASLMGISGTNDDEGLGGSVAGIGDLDGDGIPDLAAGAPGDDIAGPNAGLARAYSLRPEGADFYGAASASCNGPVFLSTSGLPTLGSTTFAYHSNHSPANALGLLLASNAQDAAGSDLFGLGVPLYVGFLTATELYGLDLFIDAQGFGAAPSPLPSNAYYIGKSYYAQALVAWVGACSLPPYNLSVSNAVKITIGN